MNGTHTRPRLGVVLLDGDHIAETLGLADPFSWTPPPTMTAGFFCNPQTWPVPTLYAVAATADGQAVLDLRPDALQGVANAVERLAGHCDLIVGGCGFFAAAWPLLTGRLRTPILLSGLDLLDLALRSTAGPVGVLTYSAITTERILGQHRCRERLRVIGIEEIGDWRHICPRDWATNAKWTVAGLERGLRELLEREATGTFADIGALVLECTALPQFRFVIRDYISVPVFDVAAAVRSLL